MTKKEMTEEIMKATVSAWDALTDSELRFGYYSERTLRLRRVWSALDDLCASLGLEHALS